MFTYIKATMMVLMAVGIFLPVHFDYRPMVWVLWLAMSILWLWVWRQTYVRDKYTQAHGGRGFYYDDHIVHAVLGGLFVWSGHKTVLALIAVLLWPWAQGWEADVQSFKTMQNRVASQYLSSSSKSQLEIFIPKLDIQTVMLVNDNQYLRKSRTAEGQHLKIKIVTTPFAYVFSAYGFYYE